MGKNKPLQKLRLNYDDASISNIQDLNDSFATGSLKVMYTGENQNGSDFSREVIEAALPSIANIPIVAHYDMEGNEIGSHDVEVVCDGDGLRFRNLTEPCGVVPESAEASFVDEADGNGVMHTYLTISPVILWKRQEVYRHIREDLGGRVDHSMEVNIFAFHKDKERDVIVVDDFSFEALCLLERAKPCFEGSELELFSADGFRAKMEEMMKELRETFSAINSVNTCDSGIDIQATTTNTEGGRVLDEKLALLNEYAMDAESLDFSLDDFSVEELREKFEAIKEAANAVAPAESAEGADAGEPAVFELSCNLRKAVCDALREKQVQKPWGMESAFWFEDYDPENQMVYAQCTETWNLYGFPYEMNGDQVVIDFDAGKRFKRAFVEFDEGAEDAVSEAAEMFEAIGQKFQDECDRHRKESEELTEKYENLNREFAELQESTADIEELRSFRAKAEADAKELARNNVFAKFEDLAGNEAFEALRADTDADLSLDELEEKCYAIRGKIGTPAKFAAKEKTPKLRVANSEAVNEPYGGLFQEFGTAAKN